MLLSNSLFLDSEYKADCENKIKYLELIESSTINDNDNTPIVNFEGTITDTTMVIFDGKPTTPNNYKYVKVSGTLYPTKQISKNYNKIILDSGTN